MNKISKFFRNLGPGLITGAADDDPSGIATYSQTGAQFGYAQLWTALFMLPLLVAIQELCARIGAVTGKGLASVMKANFNPSAVYTVVVLLLIANTINIGADIGAMAAAAQLLVPVPYIILALFFAVLIITLEVLIPYKRYVKILKYLCLSLLAYPLTIFIIHIPWTTVLRATFIPHLEFNFQFLFIITGVLGTTISPYMFFWQASQEVEETRRKGLLHSNQTKPVINPTYIKNLRFDNFTGMFFSEIVTWSIILVTATVLHSHGVNDIKTAADAAKALEPFVHSFPHAGYLAKLIFAIGIIGLGLLAVPVLAGSAAYALSETFEWRHGLNLKFSTAKNFYYVMMVAVLIGFSLNFIGIDPMKALVYSAVINGVTAVPLIFLIAMIGRNQKIMGEYRSGWISTMLVWLTLMGMGVASVAMFFTIGKS